jgi:N4 Gp49/Sf6 Gp66 family protein
MTTDEALIEQAIQAKGLNAPRLTPGDIDAQIASAEYHVFGGRVTICAMTLLNGYIVFGESAASSEDNFDEEIGRKIAYDQARNKIWALEGYALRTRLAGITILDNPT